MRSCVWRHNNPLELFNYIVTTRTMCSSSICYEYKSHYNVAAELTELNQGVPDYRSYCHFKWIIPCLKIMKLQQTNEQGYSRWKCVTHYIRGMEYLDVGMDQIQPPQDYASWAAVWQFMKVNSLNWSNEPNTAQEWCRPKEFWHVSEGIEWYTMHWNNTFLDWWTLKIFTSHLFFWQTKQITFCNLQYFLFCIIELIFWLWNKICWKGAPAGSQEEGGISEGRGCHGKALV